MTLPGIGEPRPAATYHWFGVIRREVRGRKTPLFVLINKSSQTAIGEIKWYGRWRQYCFFPDEATVWSDGCLADVRDFLAKLKEAETP